MIRRFVLPLREQAVARAYTIPNESRKVKIISHTSPSDEGDPARSPPASPTPGIDFAIAC